MGFPNRILRQHLGSKLQDRRRVENPKTEAGAARLNLLEHTAVGAGLVVARASLVAEWNATLSAFSILHQEEAWNTDHAQAHPVLARLGTGRYTYTFAATYLDNDGVAQPLAIIAARPSPVIVLPSSLTDVTARTSLSGSMLYLNTYNNGTLTDMRFLLEVF